MLATISFQFNFTEEHNESKLSETNIVYHIKYFCYMEVRHMALEQHYGELEVVC
jgi:hypothetical protein